MNTPTSMFDAYYYQHNCGRPYERSEEWLNFFGGIARRIVQEINPTSVLDAGCAMGFLVEGLRNEHANAFGVDISEYAISRAHASIQPFLRIGSISDPFPQTYDLIVCIEVLEHMQKADAEKTIANFCQFSEDILFSSTPFDYKEATHFNVQPPDYWVEQFARHGFYRDLDFDASFITSWAIRFRRRKEPFFRIIQEYDRKIWLLTKENQDLRLLSNEMQSQLSAAEAKIALFSPVEELHAQNPAGSSARPESLTAQLDAAEADIARLQSEVQRLRMQNGAFEERWADLQRGITWRLVQKLWSIRLFLIPRGSKGEVWLTNLKRKFH
jgi:SAM-dependent methyltransferase